MRVLAVVLLLSSIGLADEVPTPKERAHTLFKQGEEAYQIVLADVRRRLANVERSIQLLEAIQQAQVETDEAATRSPRQQMVPKS